MELSQFRSVGSLVTSTATMSLCLSSTAVSRVVADVGSDADLHGPALGIGQRDLRLAGTIELGEHAPHLGGPLLESRQLGSGIHRLGGSVLLSAVGRLGPLQIAPDPLVGRSQDLFKRRAAVVALLRVHRTELRAVNGHQFRAEQIELLAQQRELAKKRP